MAKKKTVIAAPVPSTAESLSQYIEAPSASNEGHVAQEKALVDIPDRAMLPFSGKLSQVQLDALLAKTPEKYIYKRQGRGGTSLDYVSIGYVVTVLNRVFNTFGWSWSFDLIEVSNMEMVGKTGNIVVKGNLTIYGPDSVVRSIQQYGSAEVKLHSRGDRAGRPVDIGDDYKAAGSDALKKCASLIGVANDIYFKDWGAFQDNRTDAEPEVPIVKPAAVVPESVDDAMTQSRRRIFEGVKAMFDGDKEKMVGFLRDVVGKESFMALEVADMAQLDEILLEPGEIGKPSAS